MKLQITPSDVLALIGQLAAANHFNGNNLSESLNIAERAVEKYLDMTIYFEIIHPSLEPPYFPSEQS